MSARVEGGREGALPPTGQVRVLVVGDAGVGKSSLVHLIMTGKPIQKPLRTVGCHISIKYLAEQEQSPALATAQRGYFVELWDVSGQELYKSSRPLFYSQVNGVILVHDLSRSQSRHSAQQWANEVARFGTFSTPSNPEREGSLPVPFLVIGNKADLWERDPLRKGRVRLLEAASKSKTLEAARKWANQNQWIQFREGEEGLPEYQKSGSEANGLISCAKEGKLDLQAINRYFEELIQRRYFTEIVSSLPSPSGAWRSSTGWRHETGEDNRDHSLSSIVDSADSRGREEMDGSGYAPVTSSPPSTPRTTPPLSSSAGFRSPPVSPLRLGIAPPPLLSITPKNSQAPPTSHQPYSSSLSSPSSTPMCFNPLQSPSTSPSLPELMSGTSDTPLPDAHIPPPHKANGSAPRPISRPINEHSLLGTQLADPSKVFVHRVNSGLKEGNQHVAGRQIHGDTTNLSHFQSLPGSPKQSLVISNGVSLG